MAFGFSSRKARERAADLGGCVCFHEGLDLAMGAGMCDSPCPGDVLLMTGLEM